jgi:SAM-dependent methyltransferase
MSQVELRNGSLSTNSLDESPALSLTGRNRDYLNQRFSRDGKGGYAAHQPIWGYGQGTSESGHLVRLARTLNLLRTISGLQIGSFLDVGGAEGYMGTLVRHFFGARVITSDLSLEAASRASELFGLRSCTANAARLPFHSDSFDLVHCSEVLEHLERPFISLLEMLRVARKYLLISTEASTSSSLKRKCMLKTRKKNAPHFDRNVWMDGDFRAMFGNCCAITPQFRAGEHQHVTDADRARKRLIELADVHEVSRHTVGLLVAVAKNGHHIPEPTRVTEYMTSGFATFCLEAPSMRFVSGKCGSSRILTRCLSKEEQSALQPLICFSMSSTRMPSAFRITRLLEF